MQNSVLQTKSLGSYLDYKLLTIKNDKADDIELLRVAYYLREKIGYSDVLCEFFETGKQNRLHIHLIISKKRMLDRNELAKISYGMKRGKLRWVEPRHSGIEGEYSVLLEYSLELKHFNWKLTEFTDPHHFKYVYDVYRYKETRIIKVDDYSSDDGFIDSD